MPLKTNPFPFANDKSDKYDTFSIEKASIMHKHGDDSFRVVISAYFSDIDRHNFSCIYRISNHI